MKLIYCLLLSGVVILTAPLSAAMSLNQQKKMQQLAADRQAEAMARQAAQNEADRQAAAAAAADARTGTAMGIAARRGAELADTRSDLAQARAAGAGAAGFARRAAATAVDLRKQLAAMSVQLATAHTNLDSLNRDVNALKAELGSSKAALGASKAVNKKLMSRLEGQSDALNIRRNEVERLNQEANKLNTELDASTAEGRALRDEASEAQVRIDNLNARLAAVQDELIAARAAAAAQIAWIQTEAEANLEGAAAAVADARADRDSARARSGELSRQVGTLTDDVMAARVAAIRARMDGAVADEWATNLANQMGELIAQNEQDVAGVQAQLDAARGDSAALRSGLDEAGKAARRDKRAFDRQLKALGDENSDLKAKQAELLDLVSRLKSTIASHDMTIAHLTSQLGATHDQLTTARSQIAQLSEERAQLRKDLSEADGVSLAFVEQLRVQSSKIIAQERHIERMTGEIAALKESLGSSEKARVQTEARLRGERSTAATAAEASRTERDALLSRIAEIQADCQKAQRAAAKAAFELVALRASTAAKIDEQAATIKAQAASLGAALDSAAREGGWRSKAQELVADLDKLRNQNDEQMAMIQRQLAAVQAERDAVIDAARSDADAAGMRNAALQEALRALVAERNSLAAQAATLTAELGLEKGLRVAAEGRATAAEGRATAAEAACAATQAALDRAQGSLAAMNQALSRAGAADLGALIAQRDGLVATLAQREAAYEAARAAAQDEFAGRVARLQATHAQQLQVAQAATADARADVEASEEFTRNITTRLQTQLRETQSLFSRERTRLEGERDAARATGAGLQGQVDALQERLSAAGAEQLATAAALAAQEEIVAQAAARAAALDRELAGLKGKELFLLATVREEVGKRVGSNRKWFDAIVNDILAPQYGAKPLPAQYAKAATHATYYSPRPGTGVGASSRAEAGSDDGSPVRPMGDLGEVTPGRGDDERGARGYTDDLDASLLVPAAGAGAIGLSRDRGSARRLDPYTPVHARPNAHKSAPRGPIGNIIEWLGSRVGKKASTTTA